MTPHELLLEFKQLGVRLEVRGDRIAYHPKSAVPTELTEALRRHKGEVLALLQPPRQQRLDDADLRSVWHAAVDRLVGDPDWPPESIEVLRSATLRWIDHAVQKASETAALFEETEELVEIDWPEPCDKCGSLEQWQSIGGEWRCLHCEPPVSSRRFAKLAERIRQRTLYLRQDAFSAKRSNRGLHCNYSQSVYSPLAGH